MSEHICQAGGCPTPGESASNKEALQSVLIWFRDAGTTYLQSFCDWQEAKPRTPSSQLVSSVLCNMSCQTPVQFSVGDLHMCAPDSFRSARCLLRGCPDDGHVNDQPQFPDRNSSLIGTPDPSLLICYSPLPPEIQSADFHTRQVSPTELLQKSSLLVLRMNSVFVSQLVQVQ